MPDGSKLPGSKKIPAAAPKARKAARGKSIFGSMKGRGRILGDIVSPVFVEASAPPPPGVEKVPMATFKARMAEYVERVASEGTTFALTKRGKVVAELSRPRAVPSRKKSIFGCMKGRIKILGDIVSPLDVEWEALRPDAKLDPD